MGGAGLQMGTEELDQIYEIVEKKFHPVAFTRSQGWSGSTCGEGLKFCASQQSKIPCPYDAVCPMSSRGPPFGNLVGTLISAWAPIVDSANGWVQIGSKDTCMKYNDLHPHPPMWGLTGKSGEAITPNILCCEEPGGSKTEYEKVEDVGPLTKEESRIV